MISAAFITAWSQAHPWSTSAQVEQDLVLSRALVAIYQDPLLADALIFRGGTALHKLSAFQTDTPPLLRPGVHYNPIQAASFTEDTIFPLLPGTT